MKGWRVKPFASQTKGTTCYLCHAGNLEVVVPVTLGLRDAQRAPSVNIGAFWGGQCRVQATEDMSDVFARLAERTGLSVEHLRTLHEEQASLMDDAAIRQLEEELLHKSEAMSKSVTIAYHERERLRADDRG